MKCVQPTDEKENLNENAILIKLLMKKYKTPNISSTYVICVDGSPMDWAARTPTGSPGSAQLEMKLSFISSLNSARSLCLWRPRAFFFFFGNFFRKSFSWLSKDSETISKDVSLSSKVSLSMFSVSSLTPILCDKRAWFLQAKDHSFKNKEKQTNCLTYTRS